MQNSTQKTREGMSLVEVLVALVFVSLAVSMFTYFIDALRMNSHAAQETTATLFARDYLEGLKARWRSLDGYENLALAAPITPPVGYELEIEINNQDGQLIYSYPGTVAGTDLSLLRKVEMRFTNVKEEKTIRMHTVIARPTPDLKPLNQQTPASYEGH